MRARRAILVAAALAAAAAGTGAQALAPCATPKPSSEAFSPGTSKTLQWSIATPNGSGFRIEVATEPTFDADGSFKDSKVVQTATVGSSVRERTFGGLPERRFYYHLRTLERNNVCDDSPWSVTVSTVQDATRPDAVFTMPSSSVGPVVLPNTHSRTATLNGLVTDPAGRDAPLASGPDEAIVRLANTTPGLGGVGEPIPSRTVATDIDGTFRTTFTGLSAGTYAATVNGVDGVGNESTTPDTYTFVIA